MHTKDKMWHASTSQVSFLHDDLDEDITMVLKMVLKGRLAELMVQVAPNLYRKYISMDRMGMAILYMKMQKAMYGLLRSALLFYRKLVEDLESNGIKLNCYDPCVANLGWEIHLEFHGILQLLKFWTFGLQNFLWNFIFPIIKCVPANSEHVFYGLESSPAIYSSDFMNQKMFPL